MWSQWPSTCTPRPAPRSSRVTPREGSLILGASPSMQFTAFPKASLLNVVITPPHLPPPGALLTCQIFRNTLRRRSTSRRSRCGREHLGTAAGWTPGPALITPSPPSPPSRRHLCFACSWDSLGNKCGEWHSGGSLIPAVTSPPFHPCLSTC